MPLISRMVRRKPIGFGIISREEEQQGGSTGAALLARFLSHRAHAAFLRQRCVKWSVKWVHLTSLQWIILYALCYAGVRELQLVSRPRLLSSACTRYLSKARLASAERHLPTVQYTVRCRRVKHLGKHFIYLFLNHDNNSLDTKTKKKNPVLRAFMLLCDQITEMAAPLLCGGDV